MIASHKVNAMIKLSTLSQRIFLCALLASALSAQAAAVPDSVEHDSYTTAGLTKSGAGAVITGFSFAPQTGIALGAVATSATANPTGQGAGATISIVSPPGATFKVGAGAYTAGPSTISDGQALTIQVTASALYNTATVVTVDINGTTATFSVTSAIATPTGFSFTPSSYTDVTPGTVWTSNTVTIGGLGLPNVPISVSNGTISIAGGAYVTSGTISNGNSLTVKLTASSLNSTYIAATVDIGGATATFSATTIAAPGVPVVIPSLPISIAGTSSLPAIGNLGSGSGPNVATRVATVLTSALGLPLRYISQNAQGTAMLSGYNGGNLAFMPLVSQTSDSRANGVYAVGNGQYQVVFNGLSNTIAPALVHLDQLLGILPGSAAAVQDNGVIVATYNGATFAVQPSVQVQLAPATGTATLTLGNDGLYRFIDAQGNAQVLYPAFAEVSTLRNTVVPSMFAGGTATIQLDGTARLVANGQTTTLGPDIVLGGVVADHAGQTWWFESAGRYRMSNVSAPLAAGTTQGFINK